MPAPRNSLEQKKYQHQWNSPRTNLPPECMVYLCAEKPSHACSVCKLHLCPSHQLLTPCINDSDYQRFIKVVSRVGWIEIDNDLLRGLNDMKNWNDDSNASKSNAGSTPLTCGSMQSWHFQDSRGYR
ncbi:hypothetical protein KIN20_032548 [Parelaphostrongylus tenuis]|uniref:Uncharacterized protein n=1 Tax=Parelaphostrongylus tenuis TaxID=148309 RepID=A0AAD5QPC0_PARTN|nr:hypothetical protein KIN20_010715 [Parelaphostrongylus tenuis]KAJ1361292.1 hypothetical protein KIN20_020508 [Parelaphostrongylus tenuis]KAJ1370744.1 hypothetical protein KIN20_032548 [Parelaphostrongylus tenuis]